MMEIFTIKSGYKERCEKLTDGQRELLASYNHPVTKALAAMGKPSLTRQERSYIKIFETLIKLGVVEVKEGKDG